MRCFLHAPIANAPVRLCWLEIKPSFCSVWLVQSWSTCYLEQFQLTCCSRIFWRLDWCFPISDISGVGETLAYSSKIEFLLQQDNRSCMAIAESAGVERQITKCVHSFMRPITPRQHTSVCTSWLTRPRMYTQTENLTDCDHTSPPNALWLLTDWRYQWFSIHYQSHLILGPYPLITWRLHRASTWPSVRWVTPLLSRWTA